MVPEIALTPSVAALFRGAFGERVAIQHSALPTASATISGTASAAATSTSSIGTRSAVFAPLARLGLIIVDEEHDTSYKQEESPRYHGRDVAIVRAHARRRAGRARLGDAVDGDVSERGVRQVRARDARAPRPRSAAGRGALVNMRDEYAEEGPDVDHQPRSGRGHRDRLARQEQVLVLLNRRGYATAVFCRQCGDTFECPNCSISLTVHRARHRMARPLPLLQLLDDGAEGVPQVRGAVSRARRLRHGEGRAAARRDVSGGANRRASIATRCSARARWRHSCRVSRRGELDVLVGTQMIAKGHDFPARDAGRRHLGRRRPWPGRLPRRRAHVSAADAGGRARRARRAHGRGHRADALSRALQHPARLPSGLSCVLRAGDRIPPRHAVSRRWWR